jgi:hypothetical protein
VALAARPNHTHASTVCLYCIGINKKEWVAARERSSSGRRPALVWMESGWSLPVWWKIETDTVWSHSSRLLSAYFSTRRSMIFNALSSFPFSRRSLTASHAQPSAHRSSEALARCYSGYMYTAAYKIGMTRDETRRDKKKDGMSLLQLL